MATEIAVLRAVFRLSRRRVRATNEVLVARLGVDDAVVRRALSSLIAAGLVRRTVRGCELTLPGLAVAAAVLAQPRARTVALPIRVPLLARPRGRRAA